MAKISYDGSVVEVVERPTLGERAWSERTHPTSRNASTWTGAESEFAQILISFKRAGVVLSWALFESATFGVEGDGDPPADFVVTPDPEPEPDPTPPDGPPPAAG